jgi:hypothetical protein
VSVTSPDAADHGVAEPSTAGQPIANTIHEHRDLMPHIVPRRDHTAMLLGAHSHAHARTHSGQPPTRAVPTRRQAGAIRKANS